MAGGRKYVAPELFREFARAGARIRLVLLEKERMAIHQEFPELAIGEATKKPKKAAPNGKGETIRDRVIKAMQGSAGMNAVELGQKLGMDTKQAAGAMGRLYKAGDATRPKRGVFRLKAEK